MLGPAGLMSARDAAGATVPTAPSDMDVDQTSDTSVRVVWTDNSNNEDNMLLYRQKDGGGFSLHQTLGKDVEEYEDTGLTTGSTYDYKVSAKNEVGESAEAGPVSIEVTASVPDAPSDLAATPIDGTQIDLSWTDNATNETEYRVYRKFGGLSWSLHDTIAADSTSYSDTGLDDGVEYDYKVAAANSAGEAFSGSVSQVPKLNTPTNFQVNTLTTDPRTGEATQYRMSWEDNTNHESNYDLLKNGAVFDTLPADTEERDVAASATTDGDKWKVQATRSSDPDSNFSNEVTI